MEALAGMDRPSGGLLAMGIVATSEDIEVAPYGWLLPVGLPTLLAFYGSSPVETIYDVSPKRPDSKWWEGSPAAEPKTTSPPK